MTPLEHALRTLITEIVREELGKLMPTPADLVTVAEFARRRSISPSTVRHAIRDGRLPVTSIGRAVRVAADATIGRPVKDAGDEHRERVRRKLGLLPRGCR